MDGQADVIREEHLNQVGICLIALLIVKRCPQNFS